MGTVRTPNALLACLLGVVLLFWWVSYEPTPEPMARPAELLPHVPATSTPAEAAPSPLAAPPICRIKHPNAKRYAIHVRRAVMEYWPEELHAHWCIAVAQAAVESGWDVSARSPIGAVGPYQVRPATFSEVQREFQLQGSVGEVIPNIRAGVAYMGKMWAKWTTDRPTECRIELAWASYNAGFANILQAQELSGGRLCWDMIAPHLPEVTGRHAAETQAYISRIWAQHRRLKGQSL